jgi:lipopolysaccharide transport system ATP-binding protein
MKSNSITVRVDDLGKRYFVPAAGTAEPLSGSPLTVALKRRFPTLRRDAENDWFWALRNVKFELERGEVLGIIGRNGAGKSTLLKLLSGIVTPSAGRATLVGRVGSLLEIGTGFHPDLSGRDNVILAAALLGIPKAEVLREFDAIVDYAGVGNFIDVPVKRYSSGMYMRLAYSVTALLRSDILLLDEVLAVGDAEFQRKTKRNVDSIAQGGRTVLFVSHSMGSITSLCTRCVWLERGEIIKDGAPEEITNLYLQTLVKAVASASGPVDIAVAPPHVDLTAHQGYYAVVREEPVIKWIETLRADGTPARVFQTGEPLRVRIGFEQRRRRCDYFGVAFHTLDDRRVTSVYSHGRFGVFSFPERGVAECVISELRLVSGDYAMIVEAGTTDGGQTDVRDSVSDATEIRVTLGDYLGYPGLLRNQGHLAQRSQWVNQPSLEVHDSPVRLAR